ncbi:MAG: hypothetical protein WD875_15485 [Pirellulales bacterium]
MPRGVKAGVNLSESIREYLKMVPKASPTEIKQALAAKGIKVSDSLISAVKYRKTTGKKKKGRKKGRPAGAATATKKAAAAAGSSISIDSLVAASKLVETLGGVENAVKAINVLKKLQG